MDVKLIGESFLTSLIYPCIECKIIKDIKVEKEKFTCGITNASKANKGTLSGYGSGDNSVKSSMMGSEFSNWKLVTEKPLNCNNKNIFG